MMNSIVKGFICILAVTAIVSCSKSIIEQPYEDAPGNPVSQEGDYDKVVMTLSNFIWETPQTKTVLDNSGFYWKSDDVVGIIPNEGTQVRFPIEAESGSQAQSAVFNGGGWALKKSSSYMAYYPFISDMELDKTRVPVDYRNQCQNGNNNTNHLSGFDFMAAAGEVPQNDNINFAFDHLSSLLRLDLRVPKVAEYKTLTLHCDDLPFITGGTVDMTQSTPSITPTDWNNDFVVNLSNFSTTSANQAVVIYLVIPPIDMSGHRIHVRLQGDHADCQTHFDRPDHKPFEPGHAYAPTIDNMAGGDVIKLTDGESFNAAIKCLANGPGFVYTDNDYSIRHIVFETENATVPSVTYVDVSAPNSEGNIYAWWNASTKTLGIRTSALKVFANEDAHGMFNQLCHLDDIDFTGLDLQYSTNVSDFLNDCYYLSTINGMSAWSSAGNVENYSGLFKGCKQLASIDVSQLNTSSAVDISSMFENCISLTDMDLSTFDTTHLEQMHSIFRSCNALVSVDFGDNFNCSNVTDFSELFYCCFLLSNLDITGLNLNNGTCFSSLFEGCSSLSGLGRSIPVDFGDQFDRIFLGCCGLTNSAIAQAIDGWDVSGSSNFQYIFTGCSITDLDLHTWDVQRADSFEGIFSDCTNLINLNINGWQTDNVLSFQNMFHNCSSLETLDLSSFVTDKVVYFGGMFSNCSSLTSLNVSGWDTRNGESFGEMFYLCSSLPALDVKHYNVSKATSLEGMFNGCSSLTSLDISGYNTSSATNMAYMFSECANLSSIDITGLNVSNVRDMSWMFYGCHNLTTITGITSLNPVFCSDFRYMFRDCYNLPSIDLSGWTTPQAEVMADMFDECRLLSSLDISNFNTNNLSDENGLNGFLHNCANLSVLKTGVNFAFKGLRNDGVSSNVATCTIYCTPAFKQAWIDASLDTSKIAWINCSTLEAM